MKAIAFAMLLLASMPARSQAPDKPPAKPKLFSGTASTLATSILTQDTATNIKNVGDYCADQGAAASASEKGVDAYVAQKNAELDCVRKWQAPIVQAAARKSPEAAGLAAMQAQDLVDQKADEKKEGDSRKDFMSMSWGVGLGVSWGKKHVTDAEIANGVVRVKTEERYNTRVVLEAHQFFGCGWALDRDDGTKGCGPFAAVVAGSSDSTISGFGLGWMWGWKQKTAKEGFSIGVGLIVDQKVKDLAAGFEPNQAPPPGETAVRFTEKSQTSYLIFVTRTF